MVLSVLKLYGFYITTVLDIRHHAICENKSGSNQWTAESDLIFFWAALEALYISLYTFYGTHCFFLSDGTDGEPAERTEDFEEFSG